MKRRWFLAGLAALVVSGGVAEAHLKAGPIDAGSGHRLKSAAVVDTMRTSLAAVYSFRKVVPAYAGPAVQLQRISGAVNLDIGFTASGDFDVAAAAAHCTTACAVMTWYDQTGLGRHMTAPGATLPYVANCIGALPCVRQVDANSYMRSAAVTWANAKNSMSTVAKRTGTVATCYLGLRGSGNFAAWTAANQWVFLDAGAIGMPPAAEGGWHAAIANFDGASSVGRLDGAEQTGSVTGSAGSTTIGTGPTTAGTTCDQTELLLWDNYALSASERIALTQNQKDYWMPLPLDSFATPAGAYSFRKLKSTYTGPAVKLRRTVDNVLLDINFLGFVPGLGAPFDTAAANAHCTTACTVDTWYDQSGNAKHVTNGAPAGQPLYIANCLGSQPCAQAGPAQNGLATAPQAWAGKTSISAVANRNSGTGQCYFATKGNNILVGMTATANNWYLSDQAVMAYAWPATDNAWHAGVGTMDGVASAARVDSTDIAGANVPGNTGSAAIGLIVGAAATTCSLTEAVIWDNYAVTSAERVALTANQRQFWGF